MLYILLLAFLTISPISSEVSPEPARVKKQKHRSEHSDKNAWKKEYEDELSRAMLASRKRDNYTRVVQSAMMSENEAVIEKIMESITTSEKYLKKIDSIDFRLNRLDIEVHEKTNNILKYLAALSKSLQSQLFPEKLDTAIDLLKTDISYVRAKLEKTSQDRGGITLPHMDTGAYRLESALDSRLKFVEDHIKGIMASVESISGVIAEVKHRQNNKLYHNRQESNGGLDSLSIISEFRKALHEQKPKRCECKIGRMDRNERYPTDCHEIQIQGFNISGIYKIKPDDIDPFYVLCDLSTAGGGWTVFQNRYDGSQDFYKSWSEYKYGFGNLAGEFWLGLEQLHHLTSQKLYELRIELETQHGRDGFAGYSVFTIAPEHEGYRISTLGSFHGSAGDSLSYHAGQKFSTYDADNDEWKEGSCATEHGGAWWYKECDKSNLNGRYTLSAEEPQGQNMYWISFKAPAVPLTKSRMMIRPLPASRPLDYNQYPRKTLESTKVKPAEEQPKGLRAKPTFEAAHLRKPYRYEGHTRDEVFFPNYS
ncbi:PREDICTED: fibrinogen C domain-containing protein 1-like isoform X1 [Papilio polytes]|uniref:fibrinogen C domain-containing protein 1-like isoform X1 n=1 Tax=Papilio polytes TaxID=76194 RepID=UPI0006766BFE|nr:PREDICTED: fibrinogen C domain-containing protein 1-like isoform X1 [Papilio polytes]